MQISLKWKVASLELDLSHLWNIEKGIALPTNFDDQLNSAWNAFLKKTEDKVIGFFDWPSSADADICATQSIHLAERLKKTTQGSLCMGIGGSYLGPAALQDILCPFGFESSFPLEWISNADSFTIERARHFIDARSPVSAIVISKSGGTTETLSAWFHLSSFFSPENIVVITDPTQGELRRLCSKLNWHSLPVPPNIGGRFSVLTAVGLLPLALQDIEIAELLLGAKEMRTMLLETPPQENPALIYAFSKFLWDKKGYSQQYFMPYETRFKKLADWYVQLWGESLGKVQRDTGLAVGPTPISALGTSDQHSLLQLFKEGPKSRIVGFLSVEDPKSPKVGSPVFESPDFNYLSQYSFSELNHFASEATQESLSKALVPTYRFLLENDSPRTLGAFLFLQETACALAGEFYGVDAFNQPGVEETKQILKKKLRRP